MKEDVNKDFSEIKVDDIVAIYHSQYGVESYELEKVTKVTATQFAIQKKWGEKRYQRKNGKPIGGDSLGSSTYAFIPTQEQIEGIRKDNRKRYMINEIANFFRSNNKVNSLSYESIEAIYVAILS